MQVNVLAGGSNGNCIAITSYDKAILVDAGIAKTKIERAIMGVSIRPDQVDAIFITHSHIDHIKGIPFANKYQIPVYAATHEWKSIKGVNKELQKMSKSQYENVVGDSFFVKGFNTHHDSRDPLGYVVENDDRTFKVSVCLDTGIVDKEMLEAMRGSDVYVIEANHDPKMVEASDYPNSVKVRILSHVGHLSNQQTADALFQLVEGKGETIYLTHLSNKNNMPGLAKMTVMKKLSEKGFIAGKHYNLEVV